MEAKPTTDIFKLGIVSGKGGVGKTSISASIASLLSKRGFNLLLADCDVETPNLAILFQNDHLGNKSNKSINQAENIIYATQKAVFLEDKCTHCRQCTDEMFCRFHALSWDDERQIPIVDRLACEGCHSCAELCCSHAFQIEDIASAKISLIEFNNIPIVSGEIFLEAQSSGKAITELKNYALEIAKKNGKTLLLADGPPGIGCPVIATITGMNYIIVIIEPTTTGLHDAQRVIEVIKTFRIPFGIVLNKEDLWNPMKNKILQFLSDNNMQLLGKIPVDPVWPESIVNGMPIVDYAPSSPASLTLNEIVDNILIIYGNYFKNCNS